jgi:hypothetical protein
MLFHQHKEKKLEAERHAHDLAELHEKLSAVTDGEGVISSDGFQEFCECRRAGDRPRFRAGDRNGASGRAGTRRGVPALGGTTLILHKDETSLLDTPVALLKEVRDREFRGGSQGVSIPIGGGMRYRVGAVRGHMVTIGSHW